VLRLKWPRFSSPYIKVDCPDGPRYILKNPKKAFSIEVADWNARIKTIVKAFQVAKVNFELEIAKKFKSLVENLNQNYADLQSHYLAAYIHFAGDPCSEKANKALAKANEEIRQYEFKLREIEIMTEKSMKSIKPAMKQEPMREPTGFGFSLDAVSTVLDTLAELISEFGHSTGQ